MTRTGRCARNHCALRPQAARRYDTTRARTNERAPRFRRSLRRQSLRYRLPAGQGRSALRVRGYPTDTGTGGLNSLQFRNVQIASSRRERQFSPRGAPPHGHTPKQHLRELRRDEPSHRNPTLPKTNVTKASCGAMHPRTIHLGAPATSRSKQRNAQNPLSIRA